MTDLKSFDRVAHVYDETRGLPLEVERTIAEVIAGVLRRDTPSPHVLEVGIGTGRMAAPLAERGVRITGVDISTKMIDVLRRKRRDIQVVLAEAAAPPFRDASFDAALFVHILHLVPDAEATIRCTLRVVAPGGVLISGADDHGENIRDEADKIIRQAVHDATGLGMRGWKPYDEGIEAFGRILDEIGATRERITAARWPAHTNARKMLQRLANKDFSSSWLIPDEALPGILADVTPRIERLFGGADCDVEFERSFSIDVARLP